MTRRDPVTIAWLAGLALAVLVYVVGPDHFLFRLENALHILAWRLSEILADLSDAAVQVVRALAIGLMATFLVLSLAVIRRGGRARAAVIVVVALFLVLVGDTGPADQAQWVAALALSGVGAAVMTGRLRQAGLALRAERSARI